MGNQKLQQVFVIISGAAIVATFTYLKEAFLRKTEKVDKDIFAALAAAKIYAAAIAYGSALAIMRRFCLDVWLYTAAVFCLSFLLIYQALFQHKMVELKNLAQALLISAAQGAIGYMVFRHWGYNFYTAAIIMAASYNLMWGTFHYHLDKNLNKKTFFEILLICTIISIMVLSATNFQAKLLDGCIY